jgi:MFS family permease
MNSLSAPSTHRWRAFALLAVAYFMTIIDLTIVNVSLPTIGRDLHFSETSLQWVVTAYALTFGGLLLLGGRVCGSARPPPDPDARRSAFHGRLSGVRALDR